MHNSTMDHHNISCTISAKRPLLLATFPRLCLDRALKSPVGELCISTLGCMNAINSSHSIGELHRNKTKMASCQS